MRFSKRRILLGTGLGLAAGVAVAVHYCLPPERDGRPHPFNHDRNAVWLEHRWLERLHSPAETEALLRRLAARGVRYLYPHLIPFDRAGHLPPHNREQMRLFLQVARRTVPDLKVLPWVGGLRVGRRRTLQGTVDLGDLAQRQLIVAECRGLIDEGFDGVHLNIEPLENGNNDLLALLRVLRTAVGPNRMLSLAGTRPGPVGLWFAPNYFWTPAYYRRLAQIVDQVVVMAYDTGLPTNGAYCRYLAYVAATLPQVLDQPYSRARVLIGVPTYAGSGLMHRTGVETLDNALLGVIGGLRSAGASGSFEGVALYAEWTTDAAEWTVYEQLWRGGAGPAGGEGAGTPAPPLGD